MLRTVDIGDKCDAFFHNKSKIGEKKIRLQQKSRKKDALVCVLSFILIKNANEKN